MRINSNCYLIQSSRKRSKSSENGLHFPTSLNPTTESIFISLFHYLSCSMFQLTQAEFLIHSDTEGSLTGTMTVFRFSSPANIYMDRRIENTNY
jgi:hypothetical protein